MNSCELTASITVLANTLASKMTDDELTALSTVLVLLGDTIDTIVTHRTLCENNSNNKSLKGNTVNNSEA